MNTVPNSICWNITSRCNDACDFCYREQNLPEVSFEEKKDIVKKIAESGVKKLTFAGGEPLLVDRIIELILYAKELGLQVGVTTNGIVLDSQINIFNKIISTVDWLTLSLDGANDIIQAKMGRNTIHASRVIGLIEKIQDNETRKCKIKVNTVVSAVNHDNIEELARLIEKYDISRWKLFQFFSIRGNSLSSCDKHGIDVPTYRECVNKARNILANKEIIITESGKDNLEAAYFVVFPNGDVRISDVEGERVVGNVLQDDVHDIWESQNFRVDLHEVRTNFLKE